MDERRIIEGDGAAPHDGAEPPRRAPLATRTLFWAVMVICGALLVATLSEAWVRAGVERQVAAAQARNAALQRDVAATGQAIVVARSPDTIEREARAWGYIRLGDHPVLVVAPKTNH